MDRFERTRTASDLDEAIASFSEAIAELASDDPGRAPHLYDLLYAHNLRFKDTKSLRDLNAAIAAGREAIELRKADPGYRAALAGLLQERFAETGDVADLDEAVSASRIAITLPPARAIDSRVSLANFGAALEARFKVRGSLEDLEEAIGLKRTALALSQPGETRKRALLSLAGSLSELFDETGRAEVLDEAIVFARRAVKARPQDSDDEQAAALDVLAAVIGQQGERTGDPQDMPEAVSAVRTALDLTPASHPDRERYRAHLVTWLALHSRLTGSTRYIDEAVDLIRGSTAGSFITMSTFMLRYELTSAPADLDEAVAAGRAGLALVDEASRQWRSLAAQLTIALFLRFRQAGGKADLDMAIALRRALLTASNPSTRADIMDGLGMLLWMRFKRTKEASDLQEAVEFGRQAVAATLHRFDTAAHLANYAGALQARFEAYGGIEDLDAAIEMTRRAVQAPVRREADLARYNSNLTHSLTCRYKRSGQLGDLDEAVAAGRRSVELISADNPERSRFLANLSTALRARHQHTAAAEDRAAAIDADLEAWAVPTAPASQRVGAATQIAKDLVDTSDVARATDLLAEAVRLLPEVSPRTLERGDQQYALRGVSGLAVEAASLALADARVPAAERPLRALSLLETGRGVMISQALDGRDDLSELRRLHPELATRYAKLRAQLDRPAGPGLSARPVETDSGVSVPVLGGERDRHALAAEFTAALDQIRTKDGFTRFGLPPDPGDLLRAAKGGSAVVLVVSDYGSDAILVTKDGVTALPLPGLEQASLIAKADAFLSARRQVITGTDAGQRNAGGAGILAVLEWLWDVVTGPVLEELGIRGRPRADGAWPRIWWVPCGVLSLLPVHAAGYHATAASEPDPKTVIDRVVSSYTPSLRALLHTRRRTSPPAPAHAMAVALPATPGLPGMGRLPNVPAEIGALRKHFGDLTLLADDRQGSASPVKANVLAELACHPIAHFSCHGHSDPSDPSRSRLLLLDHERDPFTIESLGPVALDNAQLAYLSACSTGSPAAIGLLDESVHLASAFQIAGFPHVISTLWEIDDRLSVTVADDFYAHLRDESGRLDTSRSAHAIHRAVRAARGGESGESGRIRNPFLWASYVHVGALFVIFTRQLRIKPAEPVRRTRGPDHGDRLMHRVRLVIRRREPPGQQDIEHVMNR